MFAGMQVHARTTFPGQWLLLCSENRLHYIVLLNKSKRQRREDKTPAFGSFATDGSSLYTWTVQPDGLLLVYKTRSVVIFLPAWFSV